METFIDYIMKRKKGRDVVLFGAGSFGQSSMIALIEEGIDVTAFIDNNVEKQSGELCGLPVYSFKWLQGKKKDIYVLISVGSPHEIVRQLREDSNQIDFDVIKTPYIFDFQKYVDKIGRVDYIHKILSTREFFKDDESLKVYDYVLRERYEYNYDEKAALECCSKDSQYFDHEICKCNKDTTFVDCGAFVGDTFDSYVKEFGINAFSRYFCFELEKKNYEILQSNISSYGKEIYDRVNIICKGAGEVEGEVYLKTAGGGSHISGKKNTHNKGMICKLDDEIGCYQVSFIKMDIEGSELSALKGAYKIICKYHPVLAICVYHRPDDIWAIPEYISCICKGYRFYLRQYTTGLTETVLYAVYDDVLGQGKKKFI